MRPISPLRVVRFVSGELADSLAELPEAERGLLVTTLAEWLVLERSAG
jgi:hypothetical protein